MNPLLRERQLLGLTQAQAAALIGYSASHFSLLERGHLPESADPAAVALRRAVTDSGLAAHLEKYREAARQLATAQLVAGPLELSKARRAFRHRKKALQDRIAQLAGMRQMERRADGMYYQQNKPSPLDRRFGPKATNRDT